MEMVVNNKFLEMNEQEMIEVDGGFLGLPSGTTIREAAGLSRAQNRHGLNHAIPITVAGSAGGAASAVMSGVKKGAILGPKGALGGGVAAFVTYLVYEILV